MMMATTVVAAFVVAIRCRRFRLRGFFRFRRTCEKIFQPTKKAGLFRGWWGWQRTRGERTCVARFAAFAAIFARSARITRVTGLALITRVASFAWLTSFPGIARVTVLTRRAIFTLVAKATIITAGFAFAAFWVSERFAARNVFALVAALDAERRTVTRGWCFVLGE